jgi:hypothetical protein
MPSRPLRVSVLSLLVLLAACSSGPDPRKCILDAFNEALESVKAGNARAAGEYLSESYSDARGNNKRAIVQLVSFHLRQHGSIHIMHKVRKLDIADDGTARLVLVAAVAGTPMSMDNPLEQFNADILRIEVDLAEEESCAWRITSADWHPATVEELL